MQTLYNIFVRIVKIVLPLTTIFSSKMKLFIKGRKSTFLKLNVGLKPEDKSIWFHTASLGEFEQGLPIMEIIKEKFPQHKIIVSFFSPSGYEIKKNTSIADMVLYLPLDTPSAARKFINLAHPELVFFVKYEFWPNYLKELKRQQIRTFLISGSFRPDQIFFKPYGGWMINSLHTFEYFFVQNTASKDLLNNKGFNNVTISGDTRFDRVAQQLKRDNYLDFIEEFKGNKVCLVAGSTWPEDENLLLKFINSEGSEIKIIIAPHNINKDKIKKFQQNLKVRSVLFSEKEGKDLSKYQLLILDTIGLLSKVYSYADIAYVGGAVGNTGLHNILEPATFGIPIVIGTNYKKFPEAEQLRKQAGLFSVANALELQDVMTKLVKNEIFRDEIGMIVGKFIDSNTGASQIIQQYFTVNKTDLH